MKKRNGRVADDHAERAALRRPFGRVGAAARDVAHRDGEPDCGEHRRAQPQVGPVAADEERSAEHRPDRDAEVRSDAHRRIGGLLALGRDEVGDHRLVGCAAERAEDGQEGEEREPHVDVMADREQREGHHRLKPPAGEDQRPAADPVRPVTAGIAHAAREHGAGQVREREARLRRMELLDRPDAEERVGRGAGDRADQADGEHRPQRAVDVAAPDETEEACGSVHVWARVREISQNDPSTVGPISAANAKVPTPTVPRGRRRRRAPRPRFPPGRRRSGPRCGASRRASASRAAPRRARRRCRTPSRRRRTRARARAARPGARAATATGRAGRATAGSAR